MKKTKVIQSMTGFGSQEAQIPLFGAISFELRSINHKGMEVVIHLPDGYASLEAKIKKEIEAKIRRGRITCSMSIVGGKASRVFFNKDLLKEYLGACKDIRSRFKVKGEASLDTLLHLPGVVSLVENKVYAQQIWPRLKKIAVAAIDDLVATRKKEGEALYNHVISVAKSLDETLNVIKSRFKKSVGERLSKIKTDDERVGFLKDSDITEEVERLSFHINNFQDILQKNGPIGKELDFIAQEMQREANTMAAKSCDVGISAKVIYVKSQIEKIREQLQNIE
ncbi:MAG: YicC/YloC family endoribonuclease [Candidatus Omnitrophota bacterium]|jgi:uncharacterized protein (TIGR00255 family)